MDCIKFLYEFSEDFEITDIKKLNKTIESDIDINCDLKEYKFSKIKNTQNYKIVYQHANIKIINDDENYAKIISNFVKSGYMDIIFTEEFGTIWGYRIYKNKTEALKFIAFPESASNECLNEGTLIIDWIINFYLIFKII